MSTYYCDTCHMKFEAEGTRTEWKDRTYGLCSRWTAPCPRCGSESGAAKMVHSHSGEDGDGGCGCGGSCSCGGGECSSCGGC